MRSRGVVPPPEASAALIRALGRGGAGASETISLLADLNQSVGSGRGRGRRERRKSHEKSSSADGVGNDRTLEGARSLGYKGAIDACATEGDWKKAVLLLDEMRFVSHCAYEESTVK